MEVSLLHTKINPDTRDALREIAAGHSMSVSAYVVQHILEYMANPTDIELLLSPHTAPLSIYTDDILHKRVKQYALENSVSVQSVIHTAVSIALRNIPVAKVPYATFPGIIAHALKDAKLQNSTFRLLTYIVGTYNSNWFQPNLSEYARVLNMNNITLGKCLRELVSIGYLQQSSNLVRLNVEV